MAESEEIRLFKKLISLDEARQKIEDSFLSKPIGKERVHLDHAHNRILAEDMEALFDVPPFDRSTVDGYAVKSKDTFGADEDRPIALKLCGQARVGELPEVTVEKGETAEIVTGAPLPHGANAVVMFEDTVQREDAVFVHTSVSKGDNVMKAGSDIHKDETALRKGQVLSSYEIGVLAALGITNVEVYKRPKVAILSSGAEVVEPGKPLPQGKIYDINAYALSAAVIECGGEPINLGIVEDENQKMETTLRRALSVADAVITSGGVSVGPTDVIPKVLDTLGKPGVVVHGIAVKPGKPTTVAAIDGKPVFSLPGHPTSALMIFHLLVRPIIADIAKRPLQKPRTLKAITATRMFAARGRRTFVTVHLARDKAGKVVASPIPLGLSGAVTTLSKASGFIEIHENQQFINEGEEVAVHLLKSDLYPERIKE